MKQIRKLLFIILWLIAIPWLPVQAAGTGTTLVSYTPTQLEYRLTAEVRGQGQLIDGNQSIREGIVQYTFLEAADKTFTIQPDTGYHIGSVRLTVNGQPSKEIKDQLVNNQLTIHVNRTDMHITVTFEANAGSTQKPGHGINTNDPNKVRMLWAMGIGSLILLVLIGRKKHSEEEW